MQKQSATDLQWIEHISFHRLLIIVRIWGQLIPEATCRRIMISLDESGQLALASRVQSIAPGEGNVSEQQQNNECLIYQDHEGHEESDNDVSEWGEKLSEWLRSVAQQIPLSVLMGWIASTEISDHSRSRLVGYLGDRDVTSEDISKLVVDIYRVSTGRPVREMLAFILMRDSNTPSHYILSQEALNCLLLDKNTVTRSVGLHLLANHPERHQYLTLVRTMVLMDEAARISALFAFMHLSHWEEARDLLRQTFGDSDLEVKKVILRHLPLYNCQEVYEFLYEILHHGHKELRGLAAESIVRLQMVAPEILLYLLRHPSVDVRSHVASGLHERISEISLELWQEVLQDKHEDVRRIGVDALARLAANNEQVRMLLVQLLNDPDTEVRGSALEALLSTDASMIPTKKLFSLLYDNDERVQFRAAAVLGQRDLTTSSNVDKLRVALRCRRASVRVAALRALQGCLPLVLHNDVINALADENEQVRGSALTVLGKSNQPLLIDELIALFTHGDLHRRYEVIRMLSGCVECVPLDAWLLALQDDSEQIRCEAIEALGRRNGVQYFGHIVPLLKDPSPWVRAAALRYLGPHEMHISLKQLLLLVLDNDDEVFEVALEMLKWRYPERLEQLAYKALAILEERA